MISKELLSEILDKNIVADDISNIEPKDNKITFIEDYWDKDEGSGFYRSHTINIYELANKCKEWAFEKGYTIIDYIDLDNDKFWTCRAYLNGLNDGFDWKEIYQPTSTISIFRTCQWILDNVKTNSLS